MQDCGYPSSCSPPRPRFAVRQLRESRAHALADINGYDQLVVIQGGFPGQGPISNGLKPAWHTKMVKTPGGLMAARRRRRARVARAPRAFGLDSFAGGQGEEGVDRRFEGTGVPLDLGEEEAPLERGEEGDGHVVGVDVGREMPGGVTASQPVTNGGRPPVETGGDGGAGLRVTFGQLTAERSEGAAALGFGALRLGDDHVAPGLEPFNAGEVGVPLVVDD